MLDAAASVLAATTATVYTVPSAKLYHQWLWDSWQIGRWDGLGQIRTCYDSNGPNGMMPNIIFNDDESYTHDHNAWRSWTNSRSHRTACRPAVSTPAIGDLPGLWCVRRRTVSAALIFTICLAGTSRLSSMALQRNATHITKAWCYRYTSLEVSMDNTRRPGCGA